MSDIPKRRFWQIHFGTAVVLLSIFVLMIWLNTCRGLSIDGGTTYSEIGHPKAYGFPFMVYLASADGKVADVQKALGIQLFGIILNLLFSGFILVIVRNISEHLVRHGENSKCDGIDTQ